MALDNQPVKVRALVDGIPESKTVPGDTDVRHVIEDLLPLTEKTRSNEYQLNLGSDVLDPDSLIKDAGITDTSILALTKKDGGGGTRCTLTKS